MLFRSHGRRADIEVLHFGHAKYFENFVNLPGHKREDNPGSKSVKAESPGISGAILKKLPEYSKA